MRIPDTAQKILDASKIALIIDRMAFQALELSYGQSELVVIGIEPGGAPSIASLLEKKIREYDPEKNVESTTIYINKPDPLREEVVLRKSVDLNNKTIILVDDVGNTGRTLFYAMQPLTKFQPKRIIVAVLVDRTHKRFPIKADIVGFPIATTLNEHIIVQFENGVAEGAYLF